MKNIMILTMVLCLFLCCGHIVDAKNLTFGQLPMPQYNITTTPGPAGLTGLYAMSVGFVNSVFVPFTDVTDILLDMLDATGNGILANAIKLLTLNLIYTVCMGFGVLFIVLVVLGGFFMCCCRSCWGNCGGEYVQSLARAESKWRAFMTAALTIFSILMIVPCVFVFLTNDWLGVITKTAPDTLKLSLDNLLVYADNVPRQINYTTGEFSQVNNTIISQLDSIDTTLGIPIRDRFRVMAKPTITQLNFVDEVLNTTVTAGNESKALVNTLKNGSSSLQAELGTVTTNIKADLGSDTNCNAVAACQLLVAEVDSDLQLNTNIDNINVTDLDAVINDLAEFDAQAEIVHINDELDDIPQMVANDSGNVTQDMTEELKDIELELKSMSEAITPKMLDNLHDGVRDFQSTIDTVYTDYVSEYEWWRSIVCLVAAGVIMLICVFYLLGILMGHRSYNPHPEERGKTSNAGGKLLMIGAGLSLISAWVFMMVVMAMFTVGGHAERYGCQAVRTPYEGFEFADKVLEKQNFEIKLYDVVTSCEEDQALFLTLSLDKTYDLEEIAKNITRDVQNSTGKLKDMTINLTSIEVYNTKTEQDLNDMKATGVENMDLLKIGRDAESGLNSVDLVAYSQKLKDAATAVNSCTPPTCTNATATAAKLNGFADDIDAIESSRKEPMSQQVTDLNARLTIIVNRTTNINATVDETKRVLSEFDAAIQVVGPVQVSEQLQVMGDDMEQTVDTYLVWSMKQIRDNIGACRSVYDLVYSQWVTTGCTEFVNTLGGLWFSLGWCLFFIMPSAIFALKLAKFYVRGETIGSDGEEFMEDVEMHEYTVLPQQNQRPSSKLSLRPRSAKIHPSEYY